MERIHIILSVIMVFLFSFLLRSYYLNGSNVDITESHTTIDNVFSVYKHYTNEMIYLKYMRNLFEIQIEHDLSLVVTDIEE